MYLVSMLVRSMISYAIFLASKKIVKSGIGAGESLKKGLELHRCTNCWRLYSGQLTDCEFCGAIVKPLYQIYAEFSLEDDPDRREGLDKHLYKGTEKLRYQPLKIKNKGYYDRNKNRAS